MKKSCFRRVTTMAMAVLMTLSLFFVSGTVDAAYEVKVDTKTVLDIPEDLSGKTVIVHSNDVHGAIDGYAQIAALRNEIRSRGANVILADAGDFSQGSPYVSTSKGAYAIDMMNAAGYDIATIGNHEFDYGYDQLKSNLKKAKFKTVCADVFDKNGKSLLKSNYVFKAKGGLKIGFFGMETPETLTKVNPVYVKDLKFLSKAELYTCAQSQVDALKAKGCDVVVCLAHLGVDDESAPDGNRSVDVFEHTTGIDIMIDGHSHTEMTAEEGVDPVQSTGTKNVNAGIIIIDNATKKIDDGYLIKLDDTVIKDPAVEAVAKKITDTVDAQYNVEFAKSEVDLNGSKAPGVRTEETNLGDLIADGLLWSVTKVKGAITVPDDHIIALTNGGGIRASIKAGSVTKADLNTVLPFGNTVAVVYVKGYELLEALEASTYSTPDPVGGFPQVSGIKFTIDTSVPFAKGEEYPESTYYKPATIGRVTIDSINGQPFNANDTYAVVTNNFTAVGGDTYYVFSNASDKFDTGIVMDEAVMEYVETKLGGQITAAEYGTAKGNITIK